MKYSYALANIMAVGLLMACSNAPEAQRVISPVSGSEAMQSATATQPASPDSIVPAVNQGAQQNSPPGNSLPQKAKQMQIGTPPQATQIQTAAGMNPPHGQPNHRCDIPVGAPLNSPPGMAAKTQTPQPQVVTTPQVTQTQTASGMNPPHGQPNHRCDIPVGAPLNSPPGKAPATQATPMQINGTPQASQTQSTPMQIGTPPPATQTQTAAGMNPPHGQPNHRCDIAVGAPLNSPPGKAPVFPQTSGSSTIPGSPKPADPPKAL